MHSRTWRPGSRDRLSHIDARLSYGVLLEPGTYAYGPAGMPHRGTCAAGDQCVLFIAFEGPVDAQAFEGEL